jgi:hypothetical protein
VFCHLGRRLGPYSLFPVSHRSMRAALALQLPIRGDW